MQFFFSADSPAFFLLILQKLSCNLSGAFSLITEKQSLWWSQIVASTVLFSVFTKENCGKEDEV